MPPAIGGGCERAGEYFLELRTKYAVSTSLPKPPIQRVDVKATGPSKGPRSVRACIGRL